eukprot:scaffold7918_cov165-Amphora_coffeaeformis.AAC.11
MKRSRPSPDLPILGATELAATLNGEDPVAIYHCLCRFVKIVRRERRLALFESNNTDEESDGDDSESSDENEGDKKDDEKGNEPNAKKYKKSEAWKEDTAAYNVPFVGTSVAANKDTGVIVKGQWPTGLLRAYLSKSPRAVEFTSDNLIPGSGTSSTVHKTLLRQKKGRLSQSLYKNYLRALRELVTAVIPPHRLREENNGNDVQDDQEVDMDDAWTAFVREVVKHRLSGLIQVLREETGNAKGKVGTKGGCGGLASLVLQIMTNLAKTSTETARSVVRAMEQSHQQEPLWRFLLRPKLPLEGTQREEARVAALKLAATLASTVDTVVLTGVCTAGVRDRRIATGMLYMALKEMCPIEQNGNEDMADERDAMIKAQAQVLIATRKLLAQGPTLNSVLSDLFTKDIVQSIGKLAQFAPPLSESCTFQSVLSQTDDYPDVTDREDAIEARRVLFLLLKGGGQASASSAYGFRLHESVVVKSLAQLVTVSGGLEVHRFVLQCVNSAPDLLLPFLRMFGIGNSNDGFSFLSNLNFLSKLMRQGPEPIFLRGSTLLEAEDVGLQIFPLKKQAFIKAFQSPNAMVVSQSIHLAIAGLKRFSNLRSVAPTDLASGVETFLAGQVPEITVLVKVLNRFQTEDVRPNSYLIGCSCELLLQISQILPALLSGSKLDPVKILPKDASTFVQFSTFAQWKMLRTFSVINELNMTDVKPNIAQVLRLILEVTVSAKNKRVFEASRNTAIVLIKLFLGVPIREDNEVHRCLSYEVMCWVDGIEGGIIEEFCQRLQGSISLPVGGMLELIRSWRDKGEGAVPQSLMSPILIYFLKGLESASLGMRRLTFQVAGKCLLFHEDPRGIACVLTSHTGGDDASLHLQAYAESVLKPYDRSLVDPSTILKKSTESLFGPKSQVMKVLKGEYVNLAESDSHGLMRTLSHFAMVAGIGTDKANQFLALFRLCVVLSILDSSTTLSNESLRHASRRLTGDSRFVDTALTVSRKIESSWEEKRTIDYFIDALSSSGMQKDRLNLCLGCFECALLPLDVISRRFASLARQVSSPRTGNDMGFIREAAKAHALIVMRKSGEIVWDDDCLHSLWYAWQHINVQQHEQVAGSVHEILTCVISGTSPAATALMGLMEDVSPALVIARAISFATINMTNHEERKTEFLNQLANSDSSRYAKAIDGFLSKPEKSEQFLRRGSLDGLIVSLPKRTDDTRREVLTRVIKEVSSRLQENRLVPEGVDLLCVVLKNDYRTNLPRKELLEATRSVQQICDLDLVSENVDPCAILDLLDLFLTLREKSNDDSVNPTATDICLYALHITGHEVKKSKKSNLTRMASIMRRACCIVERIKNDVDASLLGRNHNVQTLVKRCLKIGLTSLPPSEYDVGVLSLRLLRTLVSISGDGASGPKNEETSFPSTILKLSTTHSNFASLMSSQDHSSFEQRVGVAQLVLCCLLASRESLLGKEELEILQLSCRASTSQFDKIIRSILDLYDKSCDEGLCLDELIWQDSSRLNRDVGISQNAWDWLPSSIKQARVFSTLRCFPCNDNAHPIKREEMQELASIDAMSVTRDDRYCPEFLFRLFFASLESAIGNSGEETRSERKVAALVDDRKFDLATINFAQRMCDAGCLALTLAGLCSDHTSVRELAIAILFLLTKILQSEPAKQSTLWRERPQLCLLLDAVQRALAIQRSDPERHHGLDKENDLVNIPWINPLAAVFLARASMVLVRPGDALYPAINRYFLRVQGEHGAFPDLNRPPAFMSLFCNSTEDPKVAEQERLWTLEILRDSFLDERCWHPLQACHAPELLLSTISMRLGTDDHQDGRVNQHAREVELLLSILLRILVFGGPRAKSNMLLRVGLLSWLGGVAKGRPLRVLERNKGCAMLFLRLLIESLKCFFEISEDMEGDGHVSARLDGTEQGLLGLPLVLCRLWSTSVSGSEVWNFVAEGLGLQSVSMILTDLLILLNSMAHITEEGALDPKLVHEMLSKMVWKDDAHRIQTLVALTSLPMSLGDPADELRLMETLLHLVAMSSPSEDDTAHILRRVSWLVDHQSDFPASGEFTSLLCRLRPLACRSDSTRAIWRSIYDVVIGADEDDGDDTMDASEEDSY